MTDPNYTAMLLIIDRSGSMASIRDDMVGGLTAMLAEQAAEPGLLTVDIVTFDTEIELQCSLADPKAVTVRLEPRGGTALFDAIGQSVTAFGRVRAGAGGVGAQAAASSPVGSASRTSRRFPTSHLVPRHLGAPARGARCLL